MLRETYYKLRYRKWAVVDILDRTILYRGDYETCCLVQDTQYAGLAVVPLKKAHLYCALLTVAERNSHDKG